MNTFVSHPSVRIKGTENNYDPIQCIEANCPNRNPHMHCPFCVNTEYYQDPVILKAHYRVKHVDKGIEFAGLKVLRCCDHCDIVGSIKGTKEIKGAHWHCYKCRNGFNRRDEAFKHYRTHFRNPQTTFQIQVAQEVNQMFSMSNETGRASDSITQHDMGNIQVHTLTDGVISEMQLISQSDLQPPLLTTTMTNGKAGETGELQVSVAANETVGTSAGGEPQTIMIIHEDQLEECGSIGSSLEDQQLDVTDSIVLSHSKHSSEETLEGQIQLLRQRNEQLEEEKQELEKQLMTEIQELKMELKIQSDKICNHQRREQELLSQLTIPLGEKTSEILTSLKEQHEELLHQQLAHLKEAYLQSLASTQYSNSESPLHAQFDSEVVTLAVAPDGTTSSSVPMIINSEGQALVNSDGHTPVISEGQMVTSSVLEGTDITSSQLVLQSVRVVNPNSSDDFIQTDGDVIHSRGDHNNATHLQLVKAEPDFEQSTDSLSGGNTFQFRLVEAVIHKDESDESAPAKRQKLSNS